MQQNHLYIKYIQAFSTSVLSLAFYFLNFRFRIESKNLKMVIFYKKQQNSHFIAYKVQKCRQNALIADYYFVAWYADIYKVCFYGVRIFLLLKTRILLS